VHIPDWQSHGLHPVKLSLGYCQLVWREAAGTGKYRGTFGGDEVFNTVLG